MTRFFWWLLPHVHKWPEPPSGIGGVGEYLWMELYAECVRCGRRYGAIYWR